MLKACLKFMEIIVLMQIVSSFCTPNVSTQYNYHKDQQISFEVSMQICVLGKKTDKLIVIKNSAVLFKRVIKYKSSGKTQKKAANSLLFSQFSLLLIFL
jgi:hypothetical protein